jgi:adenylosuccinate synthase
MVQRTGHVDTIETDDTHKKDTACGLYRDGHKIAARFHAVLVSARDALDGEVKVVAGGCNGCAAYDIDTGAYIYYVAQSHAVDRLAVGYGIAGDASVTKLEIARELVAAAERLDVDIGWTGSTDKKIFLGDEEAYDEGSWLEA